MHTEQAGNTAFSASKQVLQSEKVLDCRSRWSQDSDYCISLPEKLGKGVSFGFNYNDDSALQINELNFDQKTKFTADSGKLCGAFFVLEGRVSITTPVTGTVMIPKDHLCLFFIEQAACTFEYSAGENKVMSFTLSHALMSSLIAQYQSANSVSSLIEKHFICFPIKLAIKNMLNQVYDCQLSAKSMKLLVQAKMMELMTELLEYNQTYHNSLATIKETDLKALYQAAKYLETNMQSPPSIVELAKIVGENDYKLKQQFKTVFGRAPFAYLTELRLNRAASLLARTELPVMQVAQEVGYKHAGNFAKNFKLKLGRTPKAYKTWSSSKNT
ncbi:helix-turn-helix transcriptional regulator [Pseudoalteromonas luteoviolacea]|uniref:HTH araC/xylS-type domain-containing protein n=1 Tax=Pseudoalteromonas luteoviolacea S4054 TaxID=1129367 RepID=A0A0F6AAP2_9GAMM|nr:AraC family transcriptional regulator [Pseudoalteromonas luteoviolacea]AOT11156.1 hypothetical protein S4054249_25340 [Pseudoalteromonas luteoviolacea]AOT15680.1 hypothetical protein S40542_23170 [Pseudoalteromonas luteoviolacea]AOT20977.1 hypothetical protein S4054_25260 [Pseudoalteromonas luteoviolacea]KKE82454.1 hypothetical protein N479_18445 [Pseudoalteromonas luteoviolacea S4054]KZN67404.1 hypothetical protein N481_02325 [Pseudoalteromonas luteoviolacea S4047-1]